jgi:hypothetical protein
MATGVILPLPSNPLNPADPASVAVWNNYFLSLQNIGGVVAPVDAQYYVATSSIPLTNERNLGALTTGLLFITVAAGIAVPSSLTVVPVARGGSNADLSLTGGPSQFVRQSTVGGAFTVGALAAADLAGFSATYTPTRSGEVNLDANVVPSVAQYVRVGNFVTVTGRFTADPTTTLTPTSFELSLPVASNIAAVADLAGVAFCGAIAGQGAAISGSIANNTAVFLWNAVDVTSQAWAYTYSYQVL